ncbi:MAG: hypothetical protein J5J00_02465 [Deltaproteobacteria bacterium]|nr:hypothetical protein [Deltaproteobacteria bacterium]
MLKDICSLFRHRTVTLCTATLCSVALYSVTLYSAFILPRRQAQFVMVGLGIALIVAGLSNESLAAFGDGRTAYNDARIAEATNAIFTYLEGSFGALVMVVAGVGAILSAAFGQYRSALGLFVVAIGAFILRSIVSTFFNDVRIK